MAQRVIQQRRRKQKMESMKAGRFDPVPRNDGEYSDHADHSPSPSSSPPVPRNDAEYSDHCIHRVFPAKGVWEPAGATKQDIAFLQNKMELLYYLMEKNLLLDGEEPELIKIDDENEFHKIKSQSEDGGPGAVYRKFKRSKTDFDGEECQSEEKEESRLFAEETIKRFDALTNDEKYKIIKLFEALASEEKEMLTELGLDPDSMVFREESVSSDGAGTVSRHGALEDLTDDNIDQLSPTYDEFLDIDFFDPKIIDMLDDLTDGNNVGEIKNLTQKLTNYN